MARCDGDDGRRAFRPDSQSHCGYFDGMGTDNCRWIPYTSIPPDCPGYRAPTPTTPTTGGNIGQWLQAKTKATGAIIEGVPNWVLLAGGGVGVLLLGGDGGGRRR